MRPLISRPPPSQPLLRSCSIPTFYHNSSHHRISVQKRLPPLCFSYRCHIFWDLDNVQLTKVEDIPVIGHAIRTALLDLIPEFSTKLVESPSPSLPLPQLTVFANPSTLLKFSSAAIMAMDTTTLVETTSRKQSVDFAMKSAMIAYVQEERKKISKKENKTKAEEEEEVIIIACVSDDTDYVQVLEYLGHNSTTSSIPTTSISNTSNNTSNNSPGATCTVRTVSIGEHKRRKRPAFLAPRKLDSLALPAACDAAITLARPRKNKINEEEQWRVESTWVNPKRKKEKTTIQR
jgi:hypothetical protein